MKVDVTFGTYPVTVSDRIAHTALSRPDRIRMRIRISFGWLVVCFVGLVWFGLVGSSFNASLEPQPRARRRALVKSLLSYAGGGFHIISVRTL